MRAKAPINRMGNKACLLHEIIPRMPWPIEEFCEVFGGSGALTFSVPHIAKGKEIYNDFDANLVNFMLVLRERPVELMCELCKWPMDSHLEYDTIKHCFYPNTIKEIQQRKDAERYAEVAFRGGCLQNEVSALERGADCAKRRALKRVMVGRAELFDVKRAAAFYKLMMYSYGRSGNSYGGTGKNILPYLNNFQKFSRRLRNTIIQNLDFEQLIDQYDSKKMFFYCDPPYHTTEGVYAVAFPESDHFRLRDTLQEIDGKCMVSYNDDEFVRDLYNVPGFYTTAVERVNSLSSKKGAVFKELIITNYDPKTVQRQLQWEEF